MLTSKLQLFAYSIRNESSQKLFFHYFPPIVCKKSKNQINSNSVSALEIICNQTKWHDLFVNRMILDCVYRLVWQKPSLKSRIVCLIFFLCTLYIGYRLAVEVALNKKSSNVQKQIVIFLRNVILCVWKNSCLFCYLIFYENNWMR